MILHFILLCLFSSLLRFFEAVQVHCIATEPTFFGNYAPPDDLDGQIIDLVGPTRLAAGVTGTTPMTLVNKTDDLEIYQQTHDYPNFIYFFPKILSIRRI